MFKRIFATTLLVMMLCCCCGFCVKPIQKAGYYCDDAVLYESDPTTKTYHTFTVNYDSYTVSRVYLTRSFPSYYNVNQTNACAPVAGSMVVGYFDTTCPNLVPNYETGYYYNGQYYYRPQTPDIIDMKEYLYTLMGTNTIEPGTSVNQFKNGLRAFA